MLVDFHFWFYVQISMRNLLTHKLSGIITCSWWTRWTQSIPVLSLYFSETMFSEEKRWSPSAQWRCHLVRTRNCCLCSAARPAMTLTSFWTRWTRRDNSNHITGRKRVFLLLLCWCYYAVLAGNHIKRCTPSVCPSDHPSVCHEPVLCQNKES